MPAPPASPRPSPGLSRCCRKTFLLVDEKPARFSPCGLFVVLRPETQKAGRRLRVFRLPWPPSVARPLRTALDPCLREMIERRACWRPRHETRSRSERGSIGGLCPRRGCGWRAGHRPAQDRTRPDRAAGNRRTGHQATQRLARRKCPRSICRCSPATQASIWPKRSRRQRVWKSPLNHTPGRKNKKPPPALPRTGASVALQP